MNQRFNIEIEELTQKYEKMIDDYEEAKIGMLTEQDLILYFSIAELNKLLEEINSTTHLDAEKAQADAEVKKLKNEIQQENDKKVRETKREIMKQQKDELSSYKKELENEDYKEDIDVCLFDYITIIIA